MAMHLRRHFIAAVKLEDQYGSSATGNVGSSSAQDLAREEQNPVYRG